MILTTLHRTVEKEEGAAPLSPPSPNHSIEKKNFHAKLESINFLQVNNIWDFSLFTEQDISGKK